MAALHLTTIPCEPYTAHKEKGKIYFFNICSYDTDLGFARPEDVITFLYAFYEVCLSFCPLEIMTKGTCHYHFFYDGLLAFFW